VIEILKTIKKGVKMEGIQYLIETWKAASGVGKDIAFKAIVDALVKNPKVAEAILKSAPAAIAEGYALRVAATATATAAVETTAARAGCSIPIRTFVARVAANFGASPKGPNPYLIACVALGTILLSTAQARADSMERQNAVPSYELYVTEYLSRMVQAKLYHPQNNAFPSPKTFDEWYAENRQ
jgi:hypothetical protein